MQETRMEWISRAEKTDSDLSKTLEYEIVPLNVQQKGSVNKRYVFICVSV